MPAVRKPRHPLRFSCYTVNVFLRNQLLVLQMFSLRKFKMSGVQRNTDLEKSSRSLGQHLRFKRKKYASAIYRSIRRFRGRISNRLSASWDVPNSHQNMPICLQTAGFLAGEIRVPDHHPMPGALTNQVGKKISPHSDASAATGGHGV